MSRYIPLTVKDSEDVYYIQKLNVWDRREVVTKLLSLLAPVLGSGYTDYQNYEKNVLTSYATQDVNEDIIEPDMDFNKSFILLGAQLQDPTSLEIQDLLVKGARVSKQGQVAADKVMSLPEYDIKDLYEDEDFVMYMKILKVSFQENASKAFMKCLSEMGYSEIVGKAQAIVASKLPAETLHSSSKTS